MALHSLEALQLPTMRSYIQVWPWSFVRKRPHKRIKVVLQASYHLQKGSRVVRGGTHREAGGPESHKCSRLCSWQPRCELWHHQQLTGGSTCAGPAFSKDPSPELKADLSKALAK